jgi:NAD(P)H-flavin reductase/ferredoxin
MSFRIRIHDSDIAFDGDSGQSVLDAAMRAGIELPYSCRKGVCSNCRGHVLEGTLVAGTGGGGPEVHLRDANEHLLCRARPASDLTLRPRHWQRADPSARKTLQAKVFKITHPAPDVTVLQLRLPAGVRARFRAGQYLQVLLPDGTRRPYSMANAPHDNDNLQLHVRREAGGRFSDRLLPTLQPGDLLPVELPHGDFWLREDSERPLVLVAGGTGFAPIKSILDHIVRQRIARPVSFYWGGRLPADLYAPQHVDKWRVALPSLRYEAVISQPPTDGTWTGRTGRLPQAVLADIDDLLGYEVYACGAPALVMALREACVEQRGLPEDRFFSDAFVSQAD